MQGDVGDPDVVLLVDRQAVRHVESTGAAALKNFAGLGVDYEKGGLVDGSLGRVELFLIVERTEAECE